MISNNRMLTNQPTLFGALQAAEENIVKGRLNCVRIAIVEEFDSENLVVKVRLVNKLSTGINQDGSLRVIDYPPIYAKVHYVGWGQTGITYPIVKGMEGVVLFSDREIESWFMTGEVTPPAYNRAHSFSDAIFLCGVFSKPNLVTVLTDCLHLFYDSTDIRLSATGVVVNGSISQTGDITSSGTVTGASLVDTSGATGTFVSQDNKVVTVENGIIKSISG